MAMKVTASDGVKVYSVSSGKSVPQWLSEGKKRSLKKDEDYRRRLELIQDFEFPAAAHRLKATPNGQFIYATGIHPPRVRCFELSQLSMKFERHLDSEIVDFQILSDDYSKVAFLCADRSIAFHAKYGAHYKTRVPHFGRDIAYFPYTADLLVAGSSHLIHRLNLEEGRFQAPLPSNSPGINKIGVSPAHGLVGAAGEEGLLECYDLRQEQCAGRFDAASAAGTAGESLTALCFDESGLHCAVGTGNGLVALFDLRSSKPLLIKDHMYSSPIVGLKFHDPQGGSGRSNRSIMSADKHIVRVWEADTGKGITSIQPPQGNINDILLWPNSGLLMMACEAPKIQAYFVPSLGPAPQWCSFLESLTEELEETVNPTVYDDYRFVTRQELDGLGMSHLVGSTLLRAYMHGFFIHNKLWQKAKAIASPLEYATVRRERIQSKLEAERAQRITLKRRLPKVNAALAAKLIADGGDEEEGDRKKPRPGQGSLLADERFQSMFQDPAFAIDESAEDYKVLHPNADRRDKKLVEEHFEALPSEDEPAEESEAEGDAESEDDDIRPSTSGREKSEPISNLERGARGRGRRGRGREHKGPQLLAAKSDAAARAYQQRESLAELQRLPLAERSERAIVNYGKGGFRIGGQRELTFTPRGRGGRSGSGGRARGRGGSRPSGLHVGGSSVVGFSTDRGSSRGGRGRSRGGGSSGGQRRGSRGGRGRSSGGRSSFRGSGKVRGRG